MITRSARLNPLDFIKTAKKLARGAGRKPRQVDLRRSISTAYYAAFHCLAQCCADSFIGTNSKTRSNRAWLQVYRAIQHGNAKARCANQTIMAEFPNDIQDFANIFIEMQEKRHRADYDPSANFRRSEVHIDIDRVEGVIKRFKTVPIAHRRAFAAYVLLERRK